GPRLDGRRRASLRVLSGRDRGRAPGRARGLRDQQGHDPVPARPSPALGARAEDRQGPHGGHCRAEVSNAQEGEVAHPAGTRRSWITEKEEGSCAALDVPQPPSCSLPPCPWRPWPAAIRRRPITTGDTTVRTGPSTGER